MDDDAAPPAPADDGPRVAPRADLRVERLTVEYPSGTSRVRPLDALSLTASDGDLVALRGPSGCGKTTLLMVLAGLLAPTAGEVSFAGERITGASRSGLQRHRRDTVGVVFQSFNLVPSLTALENIVAPLVMTGSARTAARRRAAALLDEVGLSDRADHRPGRLSGGEQQRVAFARGLARHPRLLLADEPTAHLDDSQVDAVLGLLRSTARPGRLVLVATHDERVSRRADAIVELGGRPPSAVDLRVPLAAARRQR